MCKGSRIAKNTKDAQQNVTYGIGIIGAHAQSATQIGALHALGSTTAECVYCVKTGQKLTLSNIPGALQDKFGLKETAVAEFIESERYHTDDQLDFGNGKRTQFRAFANCGVQVFVGLRHATEQAVAGIMTDAISGAKQSQSSGGETGLVHGREPVHA